jgi:proteic killer suppression protein
MIQSFADADTKQLFHAEKNRRFSAIKRVALRKLIQMNRAGKLDDLSVPPGNRLEALKGTFLGFYSIRINQPNGASSSTGPSKVPQTFKSATTIELTIPL